MKALVRVGHLSSRWDRPGSALRRSVRALARSRDLLSLTEVGDAARAKALTLEAGELGFDVHQGTRLPECAILSRLEVWEAVRVKAFQVGPDLGPGGPVVFLLGLFRHRETGLLFLFGTFHFPASVEGTWRAKGARVRAYLAAVLAARRIVRAWIRTYHPHGAMLLGDWNLSAFLAWVRAYLKATFPKWRLPSLGNRGSHGPRLIDFPLTWRMIAVAFRVLPNDGSSDHDPVVVSGWIRN